MDPLSGIERPFTDLDFSKLRLPPRGEVTPPLAELANGYDEIVWPEGLSQNPLRTWLGEVYYSLLLSRALRLTELISCLSS
jgi:hypothetical protein